MNVRRNDGTDYVFIWQGSQCPTASPATSPLSIQIAGYDLPVLAYGIVDIVDKLGKVKTLKGLVLGPGVGITCLGIGIAHSDDPRLQKLIDAGDITCAYIGAGVAVVALVTVGPAVGTVLAGAAALYPFLSNPDKYIGTVFRNQVRALVIAKVEYCEFVG